MRYEMKSMAIWPVVKITFMVSLVAGFCAGLLMAMFLGPMIAMMSSMGMPNSEMDTAKFSVGALMIFLPIFYALFMAVFNSIGALIVTACYNLFAKWVGGIEFELAPMGEVHEQRPPERVIYSAPTYSHQPPPPPPPPPRHDTPGGENI